MTAKIIIDGWNVCWKLPEISKYIPDNLDKARLRLNTIIKLYFLRKKVEYKIIYDGQPMVYSTHHPNEPIQFSSNPEKADDIIIKLIKKQSDKKRWTVITSDRQLANRVKNLGAAIVSSESFIQKIRNTKKYQQNSDFRTDPKISDDEMNYWLKKFESKG